MKSFAIVESLRRLNPPAHAFIFVVRSIIRQSGLTPKDFGF
jgi:hypothetical protein